jgi:hypothetical protein
MRQSSYRTLESLELQGIRGQRSAQEEAGWGGRSQAAKISNTFSKKRCHPQRPIYTVLHTHRGQVYMCASTHTGRQHANTVQHDSLTRPLALTLQYLQYLKGMCRCNPCRGGPSTILLPPYRSENIEGLLGPNEWLWSHLGPANTLQDVCVCIWAFLH